ncbi:hypothetical protein JYU34_009579 [Plutella xylostella]|uniref:Uncharacterized protein n=1 Tax=Plutella xylostella TaxID=51655 RepID=A0ABQ7QL64_PLUXY|nr:hypothetical protein JYU34_009579 [Plutella xylostella]
MNCLKNSNGSILLEPVEASAPPYYPLYPVQPPYNPEVWERGGEAAGRGRRSLYEGVNCARAHSPPVSDAALPDCCTLIARNDFKTLITIRVINASTLTTQ